MVKKTKKSTDKLANRKKKSLKKEVASKKSANDSSMSTEVVHEINMQKLYIPIALFFAGVVATCLLFIVFGGLKRSNDEYYCNDFEPLSRDCLRENADEVGLNMSKFDKCINEDRHYEQIEEDIKALEEYGIQGTPHIVLGELEGDTLRGFYAGGAQTYEYFEGLINQIKEEGVESAHALFIEENIGTVEDLTLRYEEAYKQQLTGADEQIGDDQLKELAQIAAESRFESFAIRQYDISNAIRVGTNSAGIGILEYSDYGCGYCQMFAQEVLPKLRNGFIDKGEVLFAYKSLPIEETPAQGYRAANAAKCAADQDKFIDYHNLLFDVDSEGE